MTVNINHTTNAVTDENGNSLILKGTGENLGRAPVSDGANSYDWDTLVWKDLIGSITVRGTGPTSPALSAYRGGNIDQFAFSAGDEVMVEFHIPHDYAPGTDIYLHFHWSHNGTAISGNMIWEADVSYAKGFNQAAFSAEFNTSVTYATVDLTTTPRYQHRIDELQLSSATPTATQIDSADLEVDGVILMRVSANAIPTITGGAPNEPFLHFVDVHYQANYVGTKHRATNGSALLNVTGFTGITSTGVDWEAMAYSPSLDLFVAAGQAGELWTSTDGLTWTAQSTMPSAFRTKAMVWADTLALFVAVSDFSTNRVQTSPDGITWTERSAPARAWEAVEWSNFQGKLVAVQQATTNNVMTSTDGINWTEYTVAGTANGFADVAYSPSLNLWAACGDSNEIYTAANPDSTWTSRTTPDANYVLEEIVWDSGLARFYAFNVAATGANEVYYSANGTAWTYQNIPQVTVDLTGSEAVATGGMVIVVSAAHGILYTVDGNTWVQDTTPIGSGTKQWQGSTYAAELGRAAFIHSQSGAEQPLLILEPADDFYT